MPTGAEFEQIAAILVVPPGQSSNDRAFAQRAIDTGGSLAKLSDHVTKWR